MGESPSSVLDELNALLSKLKDLPNNTRQSIVSTFQEKLNEVSSSDKDDLEAQLPKDENSGIDILKDPSVNLTVKIEIEDGDVENEIIELPVSPVNQPRPRKIPKKKTQIQHQIRKKSTPTPLSKLVKKAAKSKIKQGIKRSRTSILPLRYNNFSGVPNFLGPTRKLRLRNKNKLNNNHDLSECIVKVEKLPDSTASPEVKNEPSESLYDSDIANESDVNSDNSDNVKSTKKKRGRKKQSSLAKTCTICDKTYGTSSYLRIHMRKHTGEKPFQCERCDRRFSQKSSLWVHLKRHEGKYDHQCTMCDYKSVLKVDLVRHIAKHTGSKVFICEQCGKMFTTDMRLRDHIRHVHERSETHICEKCGFSTHRADNLRRHMSVKHSDEEYFKCPVCGDLIKQRATFIVHLRRHTGERPHECDECGKGFKSLSQLAVHRRTHKEGEHICPECSHKFKTKHHLHRHLIVHTGAKPFSCMYCPYTCNVKGNINKHIKSVHKLLNFSFKKLKAANDQPPAISNEDAAVARGALVTQDFLKRISLRKDEHLTVEALQKELPQVDESVEEEPVIKRKANANPNSPRKRAKQRPKHNFPFISEIEISDGSPNEDPAELVEVSHVTETDAIPALTLPQDCVISEDSTAVDVSPVTRAKNMKNNTDLLFLSVKEVLGEQVLNEQPTSITDPVDLSTSEQQDEGEPATQTIYLISI